VDVTARYVRSSRHSAPRTRSSEVELLHILEEINSIRLEKLSQEDKTRLRQERDRESQEFQGYLIAGLVRDVCRNLDRYWASGSNDMDVESSKALEGRTSGNRKS
jgi:hypothetical protein